MEGGQGWDRAEGFDADAGCGAREAEAVDDGRPPAVGDGERCCERVAGAGCVDEPCGSACGLEHGVVCATVEET